MSHQDDNPAVDPAGYKALVREALVLLMMAHGDDGPHEALHAWRGLSPDHARAYSDAQREWALMGLMDEPSLSAGERLRLSIAHRTVSLVDHPRRLVASVAAVMVLVLAAAAQLASVQPEMPNENLATLETARHVTRQGEQLELALSDGSSLWLDWNTELTVSLSAKARKVEILRGQARFKVNEDSKRPFTVTAGGAYARVLGTEFVVSRLRADAMEVAVLEGQVEVATPDGPVQRVVKAAQSVRVVGGSAGQIAPRSLAEIGAWREGVIVFENRPLVDALAALEPYSSYVFDTRNVLDGQRPVSGTFLLSKADSAVMALFQSYELDVEEQRGYRLILKSAPPARPE